MRKIAVGFLLLLALLADLAFAQPVSVINSKHNLSTSGTGSIKAFTETQICVFCHTPHGGSNLAQLWNKQPTSQSYTLYSSSTLTNLGYTGVANVAAAPSAKSKLCLSCHDGTVALGSVYNLPGSGGGAGGTIQMQNAAVNITFMPANSAAATGGTYGNLGGALGTNLADDHPVGYLYRPAIDPELWAWPMTNPTAIKLDPDNSGGTVECLTCHNPHDNQYKKFLRVANPNTLCINCHNKTGYVGSAHQVSTVAFTPPFDGTLTTVGNYSCAGCHKPHGALGTPLLRGVEQNTCYTRGCHGDDNIVAGNVTPATGTTWRNIQLDMNKTRAHPTNTVAGLHQDLPFVAGTGTESAAYLTANRHAECPDCHNPHQLQKNVVAVTKSTRDGPLAGPRVPLRISLALKGMWGVQPTWPQPATATLTTNVVTFATTETYTVLPAASVTDEYQVCMKCHSGFAKLAAGRNIAQEINPNNSSYHGIVPCPNAAVAPAVGNLYNAKCTTNFFVNQNTMAQPWGGTVAFTKAAAEVCRLNPAANANCTNLIASRGRVWCSDCHGSNVASATNTAAKEAPYGPHGSANNGVIGSTVGGTIGGTNSDRMLVRTIASTSAGTPLCLGCHVAAEYTGNNNSRGYHGKTVSEGCFGCHMWDNPLTATGGTGKIYPHGMNKRWSKWGTTAVAGSTQMADSFSGGWYTNLNYSTVTCSTDNNGAKIGASPCGARNGTY